MSEKVKKEYWDNGKIKSEMPYQNAQQHGIEKWYENGHIKNKAHWLYGEEVSKEEYRRYELINKLSGLKE